MDRGPPARHTDAMSEARSDRRAAHAVEAGSSEILAGISACLLGERVPHPKELMLRNHV